MLNTSVGSLQHFLMTFYIRGKENNRINVNNCCFKSLMNSFLGTLTAEVLSPDGRLPVNIRKPDPGKVQVGFTAKVEGKFFVLAFVLLKNNFDFS